MKTSDEQKREEALLAISLWEESGLSQGAFCLRERIARSTFQHWRRRYDPSYTYKGKNKSASSQANGERFIALETVPISSSDELGSLEIIYTNDVRIKCPSSISLSDLQKLISLQATWDV